LWEERKNPFCGELRKLVCMDPKWSPDYHKSSVTLWLVLTLVLSAPAILRFCLWGITSSLPAVACLPSSVLFGEGGNTAASSSLQCAVLPYLSPSFFLNIWAFQPEWAHLYCLLCSYNHMTHVVNMFFVIQGFLLSAALLSISLHIQGKINERLYVRISRQFEDHFNELWILCSSNHDWTVPAVWMGALSSCKTALSFGKNVWIMGCTYLITQSVRILPCSNSAMKCNNGTNRILYHNIAAQTITEPPMCLAVGTRRLGL
jgi:hypothetical protein